MDAEAPTVPARPEATTDHHDTKEMKERPILMSAPMVRACLDGTKTQTRRVVQTDAEKYEGIIRGTVSQEAENIGKHCFFRDIGESVYLDCPYGQPGDRLAIKENAWMWCEKRPAGTTLLGRKGWRYVPLLSAPVIYCADHPEKPQTDVVSPDTGNVLVWRKKPGRFLPKWAVRILGTIENVGVERLQDISEDDAKAEGIEFEDINDDPIHPADTGRYWRNYHPSDGLIFSQPIDSYRSLWESIHGPSSWALNPWVWVVSFKVLSGASARAKLSELSGEGAGT